MEDPKPKQERPKQEKPKQERPKQEKPKQEKPKQEKSKQNAPKTADKKAPKKPSTDFPLPQFVQDRISLYDQIKQNQKPSIEEKPIKVTLRDGKVVDAVAGKTTPFDIAKSLSSSLANNVLAANVDGNPFDIFRPLEKDSALELFDFNTPEGKHVFWHSSAHLLGQALERRYEANLCIGPALSEGFYYDAATNDLVSDAHYEEIENLVDDIIKQKQNFERLVVSKEDALNLFKFNKYKVEIIGKIPDQDTVTLYRCGSFIDLCRGPHIPNTNRIKAFKVTKNSSAYWLGKAENDSLQRVYGISFPDAKLLKEWEEFQAEAARRDHRLIGKQQELFFFHTLSPGSCFFLPHGTRIYNKLMELIRNEYRDRGFTEVITPNIYDVDLWTTSGHWQNYSKHMFSFDVEGSKFALKPMNCPGHCLMFDHRPRSYRELPLRFADFGVLHRNEFSGALTGLTRVRRFQQDDAHIFCTADTIEEEITGAFKFMEHIYGIFGYEFTLELSTRPEEFLGEISVWDEAEKALEKCLNRFGYPWKLNPGDGAFYGPKIDIQIHDALKRAHQCATIQLDFQLPLRFNLEYQTEDKDGKTKRPVIIHRAILGSVERMFANLVEHFAGKWPFWLSPRQIIIATVSEKFLEYAEEVRAELHAANFFVEVDGSDKKLPKKIREAQLAQYNYILVIGQEEASSKTINVRTRDNVVHGSLTCAQLIKDLSDLVKNYK